MEGIVYYSPAIISAAATAVFTVFSTILVRRLNKKMEYQEQENDERKMQEMQRQEEHAALVNGVQAILRDRLINAYNHYKEKEKLPVYAMENVTKMYEAYHGLGGNGTITKLYNELMKLPHE